MSSETVGQSSLAAVPLTKLTRDLGSVEYNGSAHPVKPMKGAAYQSLMAMRQSEAFDILELYRIAHTCVPTLTWEQMLELDALQVDGIIAIADGRIREVEAHLPKPEPPAVTS